VAVRVCHVDRSRERHPLCSPNPGQKLEQHQKLENWSVRGVLTLSPPAFPRLPAHTKIHPASIWHQTGYRSLLFSKALTALSVKWHLELGFPLLISLYSSLPWPRQPSSYSFLSSSLLLNLYHGITFVFLQGLYRGIIGMAKTPRAI
jgi:hypothetical protein